MNPDELKATCYDRLERKNFPLLVETYLPGREFTVGILGSGEESFSVGAMEVLFRSTAKESVYSYDFKTNYEQYIDYAASRTRRS